MLRIVLLLAVVCANLAIGDEVLRWNKTTLDLIRLEKLSPPIATRALAMVHSAAFDAVNSVHRTHTPYLVAYRVPKITNANAAAAAAAYRVLRELFPAREEWLVTRWKETVRDLPWRPSTWIGIRLGRSVAEDILESRSGDNLSPAPATPAPEPAMGVWQPTPPAFAPFLIGGWGTAKPWAIEYGSQFRPGGPTSLTSFQYFLEVFETQRLGEKNSTARTPEQTEIARFWADGPGTATPPGHWNEIAQTLSREKGLTVVENARLFALLNLAAADTAIAAWDAKWHFHLWRPITAIRNADEDNNVWTFAEKDWEPLLPTPNHGSYVSGHSSFSGAASQLLSRYFATDNLSVTVHSETLPEVTRSFSSLSAVAQEAGQSRIYGGIHFPFDHRDGIRLGNQVADFVYANVLLPIH